METKNRIPTNNGRYKRVEQTVDAVYIHTEDENGNPLETAEGISGADFVMMLNWYHYQKEHGNQNLTF